MLGKRKSEASLEDIKEYLNEPINEAIKEDINESTKEPLEKPHDKQQGLRLFVGNIEPHMDEI